MRQVDTAVDQPLGVSVELHTVSDEVHPPGVAHPRRPRPQHRQPGPVPGAGPPRGAARPQEDVMLKGEGIFVGKKKTLNRK